MNIEKGYLHISIGGENKMLTAMYTLNFGHGVHESSYHVTNLSTDAETAVKKAMALCQESDIPLNNTSYVSDSSLNDIDRRNQEQIDAVKPDKEENIARAIEISP
jgi:hypothetical protein